MAGGKNPIGNLQGVVDSAGALLVTVGGEIPAPVSIGSVDFETPSGASSTSNYINLTATIPVLSAQFAGVKIDLTEPENETETIRLLHVTNTAATVTNGGTLVGMATSLASGTTGLLQAAAFSATSAGGSTGGRHLGLGASADDGEFNIGAQFDAYDAGTYNVAVWGNAEPTATNTIGGLFQLQDVHAIVPTPPAVSAALVADNVAAALPIFLGLDNGVEVFRIEDGGAVVTKTGFAIKFGGTTSAFPALERSGTGLFVKLADDSGYGNINAGNVNAQTGQIQTAGVRVGLNFSAYGAGTAYAFTNTAAAIDFGTTDPSITLTSAGTYLIRGQVNIAYTGATVAAETATIKVRRTNNTAADLSAVVVLDLPVSTVLTHTYGVFTIPPFVYTTAATDDIVTLFANVSAGLGAGTIDATAIGTAITAVRLY